MNAQGQSCGHTQFVAHCAVTRLTEEEGGPITGYQMDVGVSCGECGELFTFLGPAGFSLQRPLASVDGVTLHCPIMPQAARASFIDRLVAPLGRPHRADA